MRENTPFLGVGHNPDGPDLPLGYGMLLAEEPRAIESYSRLSIAEKSALIGHIQSGSTGAEAEALIANAVEQLKNDSGRFWE